VDPAERKRRERFTTIYESNYHRLLGYALRRTSEDVAADVVAEVFLVAWRRLEEVPREDEARLWLYGVARRVLANHERSRRRRVRLSERVSRERIVEFAAGPPGAAAEAFARLRRDDRELLALVAWEGLDAGEIAQVYGCSRNAARIRLSRARRRFARELVRTERTGRIVTFVETEEPL
jgi:DNA-directed RNA polymerase specialized sigma24 family protein